MADPATIALISGAAKSMAIGKVATAAGAASTAGLFGSAGAFSAVKTLGTLSTVGSALSTIAGGQAQSDVSDYAIQQEKIRTQDEAIARREKLLEALSQQNARVGASGITTAGTPTQLQETDIKKFEYEDLAAGVSSRNQQRIMKAQGQTAKTSSRLGAGLSLLSSAADMKKIG